MKSEVARDNFGDSLISLANAWADSMANDSTLDNRQTPLNINDISLPSGGLFDVKKSNYWSTPHKEHRTGKQADIGVKDIDKKMNV